MRPLTEGNEPLLTSNEPTDAVRDIPLALLRIMKSLVFRDDAPLEDIPISQIKCLHTLAGHEGQKVVDLAQRMEMALPGVSRLVDRLVKRGMVERRTDLQDRRVVRLYMTEEARRLFASLHEARRSRLISVIQTLTPEAQQHVMEGLQLLANAAEQVEHERQEPRAIHTSTEDPIIEALTRHTRRKGKR